MAADDLQYLLCADPVAQACESLEQWWPRRLAQSARGGGNIDHAIAGGYAADRLAWAFCSGYQAALRELAPELPATALASLCVSEAGGNHPRAIQATLARHAQEPGGFVLDGHKRWTSLGGESALMLVAARIAPAAAERIELKLVRVAQDAPGVSFKRMPNIGFIPEVPHAEVHLERVRVAADALLPGDGYERYVKPFRTLEDLHVHAAVIAYLLREARRLAWPHAFVERSFALLHALRAIAPCDACAATTHLALAGALEIGAELLAAADAHWRDSADAASKRWWRDKGLLSVAASARAKRSERAWERLRELGPSPGA